MVNSLRSLESVSRLVFGGRGGYSAPGAVCRLVERHPHIPRCVGNRGGFWLRPPDGEFWRGGFPSGDSLQQRAHDLRTVHLRWPDLGLADLERRHRQRQLDALVRNAGDGSHRGVWRHADFRDGRARGDAVVILLESVE